MTPKEYRANSLTEKQGRKVLSLSANVSRSKKSTLNVESANWKSNAEVDPFASTKTGAIQFEHMPYRYKHQSSASIAPKEWRANSVTESKGRQVLSLDTFLGTHTGSLQVECPYMDTKVEGDVRRKRATLNVNGKQSGYKHASEISAENGNIRYNANTLVRREAGIFIG